MKSQKIPNSPYFIVYDDIGNYCVSYDSNGNQRIPESETQAFLDAVANGLLYTMVSMLGMLLMGDK